VALVEATESKGQKRRLHSVSGTDLKLPEFCAPHTDDFVITGLQNQSLVREIVDQIFDEVYRSPVDIGR
jgi:hypothetical protein